MGLEDKATYIGGPPLGLQLKIASPDHGDQFCTGYRDFFTTGVSLPVDHGGDTTVIEEPAGYLNSKGEGERNQTGKYVAEIRLPLLWLAASSLA